MQQRVGWAPDWPESRLDGLLASARSSRLRQIRWRAQAVTEARHPLSVATFARRMRATTSLDERAVILADLVEDPDSSRRLLDLSDIFEPVEFYSKLANHAAARGWTTFPTVLSRDKAGAQPFLRIANGHNIRAFGRASGTRRDRRAPRSVGNDVLLGGRDGHRGQIVTGPNNQGKTTYLRMAAQLVRLAQLGLPVPADAMTLTPLRLRAQLAIEDRRANGAGLFKSEAEALGKILAVARRDPFTLIIADEVMPGTITEVREASERAFLEKRGLGGTAALSLIATHNWSTTEIADRAGSPYRNAHVERFRVERGPASDLSVMFSAARAALLGAGWDVNLVRTVRKPRRTQP